MLYIIVIFLSQSNNFNVQNDRREWSGGCQKKVCAVQLSSKLNLVCIYFLNNKCEECPVFIFDSSVMSVLACVIACKRKCGLNMLTCFACCAMPWVGGKVLEGMVAIQL